MARSRGRYHGRMQGSCAKRMLLIPCIVMSFMSAFGGPPRTPPPASSPSVQPAKQETNASPSPLPPTGSARESPAPTRPRAESRAERPQSTRPMSMVGAYQPPLMEIAHDTIPELLPIFTFLNSHSNKLYQEGYFLKLNDLDSRKPGL